VLVPDMPSEVRQCQKRSNRELRATNRALLSHLFRLFEAIALHQTLVHQFLLLFHDVHAVLRMANRTALRHVCPCQEVFEAIGILCTNPALESPCLSSSLLFLFLSSRSNLLVLDRVTGEDDRSSKCSDDGVGNWSM
jgi:hypothetical protein